MFWAFTHPQQDSVQIVEQVAYPVTQQYIANHVMWATIWTWEVIPVQNVEAHIPTAASVQIQLVWDAGLATFSTKVKYAMIVPSLTTVNFASIRVSASTVKLAFTQQV